MHLDGACQIPCLSNPSNSETRCRAEPCSAPNGYAVAGSTQSSERPRVRESRVSGLYGRDETLA